ncbi:YgaP-like transmembrane domain [Natronoarchaeum sp. GCM10025703]|uniref:YgaP-like transmembrane domain n=1 Tax=unclassified Natronoarchaeum TaxID=2620183 RepID=UPI00361CE53C
MNRNVGRLDAIARVVAGGALAVLAALAAFGVVTVPVFSALGVGIVAVVLVVEGATQRCLLYRVLGIDRCPVD